MGTLYKTTCNSCFDERVLSWGDGMFHLQYQCKCCLKLFNIPRKAPRPNRNGREVPKFLEKHNYKSSPSIPINEITRFTDENLKSYIEERSQWRRGDDEWDSYEIDQLISLMPCKCEADFIKVTAETRLHQICLKCGSEKLEFLSVGVSD